MSFSLSDIVVPTFLGGLGGLVSFVEKAVAHADGQGVDPQTLFEARLYEDMFPLSRQIQVATDTARRGVDRLAGKEPSSVADDETTFGQLLERIAATVAHVGACDRDAIDGFENRAFKVNIGVEMDFTGRSYAMTFAVPNFLFHVSTAYGILRSKGVELGKRDYIGSFMRAGQA